MLQKDTSASSKMHFLKIIITRNKEVKEDVKTEAEFRVIEDEVTRQEMNVASRSWESQGNEFSPGA